MIYLDTSYIIKAYVNEAGSAEVLDLIERMPGRSSASHGRVEFWAGIYRHLREGNLSRTQADRIWRQFTQDEAQGLWHWLPINEPVIRRSCAVFEALSDSIFLPSADALHLASASVNGFTEVYSNDRRLLDAAPHFGLIPVNVIAPP